jgi:selenocysteine-specific elongation factor
MIIGTAGHIDHGKSTLLEALTGRRMDPLAEEQRRGITLDLHFTSLDLGDGVNAGVVDVPGHEDLVRTMVAGAAGIDLVLLVVAADEGIMPQTREHLAVVQQLGIPAGIPVITKVDTVEREWAEMVALEVSEWLSEGPVPFSSPVLVSATRGDGISELRERIRGVAKGLRSRPLDDLFRLPIDRALSVAGVGTVVTGTAWSGSLARGETVRVLPSGRVGRVRTIQNHGSDLERSVPGARTAVGIAGIEREDIHRGDVLVRENEPWAATTVLDAVVTLIPTAARQLSHRGRVRVHLGSAEVLARVRLKSPLLPGQTGAIRLLLETPTVARGGDRFVLRSYSPVETIGGGWITDPDPPRRSSALEPGLTEQDPARRGEVLVRRRPAGLESGRLPLLLGITSGSAGQVAITGAARLPSNWIVPEDQLELVQSQLMTAVANYQRGHPAEQGAPQETLRHGVRQPPHLVEAAMQRLMAAKRLVASEGFVHTPEFKPGVEGGSALIGRLVELVRAGGLTPPDLAELEQAAGAKGVRDALRLAARSGAISQVEPERYYSAEALGQFRAALIELGSKGPITPPALRERLGLSRKYLIPLLEWADRERVTVRSGDARRLVGQ